MRGGVRKNQTGRPKGSVTNPTKVIRVPISIETEKVLAIPSLELLLEHWESECEQAGKDSPRYHFLRQALSDIRALGL